MAELEQDQGTPQEITALTAEIVGAYVGHHIVAVTDLSNLIATVGKELAGLCMMPAELVEKKPEPVVPINRSVQPNAIACLICGKPQKMLKRHLATRHDLEPNAYRTMFGLKDDYPLVAPAYAATRSALAKKIGLGRKPEPARPSRKRAVRKPAAKEA